MEKTQDIQPKIIIALRGKTASTAEGEAINYLSSEDGRLLAVEFTCEPPQLGQFIEVKGVLVFEGMVPKMICKEFRVVPTFEK